MSVLYRSYSRDFFGDADICSTSPLARLLFLAAMMEADREGRLVWQPRTLKLRYLPADACNIDQLADELIDAGLVTTYEVDGRTYACIPSFGTRQVINNREAASVLPSPTRGPRDDHASPTRPPRVRTPAVVVECSVVECNEMKGNEEGAASPTTTPASPPVSKKPSPTIEPAGFTEIWAARTQRSGTNSRQRALKAYNARIKAGIAHADMLAGLQRYARYCEADGIVGQKFVQQVSSFLGEHEGWLEPWAIPTAARGKKAVDADTHGYDYAASAPRQGSAS